MNNRRWVPRLMIAGLTAAVTLGADVALAYTAPYSTPEGITLVDVSKLMDEASPQLLWRRLGDATGNPLYTYDADQNGKSSCYDACAKAFLPLVADARAKAADDWSIVVRDDHVRQWAYQGKPLYRYSGKDPVGEPVGARFELAENPAWHNPASRIYSPKKGWRRAGYAPENSTVMPPTVELDGLAIANGFGFVEAVTHMTIYAAPVSHKLSSAWHPVRASALARSIGEFSVITRKDDDTRQWTYRGEVLYTYAGDYAPGEATGLFTGDRSIQAALAYRNFMPDGITIGDYVTRGPLMTTAKGMALYRVARYVVQYGGRETRTGYDVSYNDIKEQGTLGCQGDCTATWKPLLAPARAQARGFWELIAGPNGSKQWAFKGSPVYTYIGDKKPGDIQGNNRHVVVYGGSQGQIVYANIAHGPRDVQSSLGTIDLQAAVGPGRGEDVGNADAVAARAPGGKAAGAGTAGQRTGTGAARAGAAAGAAPQAAVDRRGGAGFYWHVVGLFY